MINYKIHAIDEFHVRKNVRGRLWFFLNFYHASVRESNHNIILIVVKCRKIEAIKIP